MEGKGKKKMKSEEFHRQMKANDEKFEALGLERPQDTSKELIRRSRQLNFGLLSYQNHPTMDLILKSTLKTEMMQPRNDFKIVTSKPFRWVRTPEEFQSFRSLLSRCSEIAIDVEFHTHHSLKGFVGLVQIGTWEHGVFLLDPFCLHNEISNELKQVLESPKILKIGHDIRNDTLWLQANFDIFMVCVVDTKLMHEVKTGQKMVGLSALVHLYYPDIVLPNATLSDWRLRPGKGMTAEQEQYAVNDVYFLLRVFDQLRAEVTAEVMLASFEETKQRLRKISPDLLQNPQEENYDDKANRILYGFKCNRGNPRIKSTLALLNSKPVTKAVFLSLLEWRDLISKIIDEKPEMIVRSEKLLYLSTLDSPSIAEIKSVIGKVHPTIYLSDEKPRQLRIIKMLIESAGTFITDIRKFECMNCFRIGHGPPWACPFPKNKENYKAWFNRPENFEFKKKQDERRFTNMARKRGEEHAKEVIARTKRSQ